MNLDDDISNRLFHEINFDLLRSQSNIYGISSFKNPSSASSKLLISLLEGSIMVWEYNRSSENEMKCVSKEVAFTYIPGKCHIISVNSFSCVARGLIVGVTFCKESSENFLNIYCSYGDDVSAGQEWNIDHVAKNCRIFELSFTPYQLTHCKVTSPRDGENKNVFILLGSDGGFHVYAQGKNKDEFTNVVTADYFCEFDGNYGIPTFLEIYNTEDKRISAIGNAVGGVTVLSVDAASNTIKSSWSIQHNSPIAQCSLFCDCDAMHLVVVSAREVAVVYKNVLKNGLKEQIILDGSDNYDVITSCAVADINYDGMNEILIGSYGGEAIAYSFDPKNEAKFLKKVWSRKFSAPILKLQLLDLTGDGMDEMVVVTTSGVHMMQANLTSLLRLCKLRLNLKHNF